MRKLWVLFFLPLLLLNASPGYAQGDFPQIQTDAEVMFGSTIELNAQVTNPTPPIRAHVYLRPTSGVDTHVLEAQITLEGNHYLLSASLDVREVAVQPFEMVIVWWQIDFEGGNSSTTPSQSFRYDDTRFDWKDRVEGNIGVHWVNGDLSFGEHILSQTNAAMQSIQRTLGLLPPEDISLYVYPSAGDLQSAIDLGGARWINGHTFPELGVLLLSARDDPESMVSLERNIPHELTHLMLFTKMQRGYNNLPAWLSEGLATLQEPGANPAYRFELENAVADDALISFEALCAAFPVTDTDALLAYAQSASFTRYLLDVYGMGGILQLLDAYQEGASCTGAVQRVYQRPLSQLESEWKSLHLSVPSTWQRIQSILPWGLLILLVLALVAIGMIAHRKRAEES